MTHDLYAADEHTWMETQSGLQFNYTSLNGNTITIEDVAHALSKMCRYNGHVKGDYMYSVAEHCVLMSRYVMKTWNSRKDAKLALLHDAGEAYIADMVRPAKHRCADYLTLEKRIDYQVAAAFDLELPMPKWLKDLDTRILVDERAQVMNPSVNSWAIDGMEPLGVRCKMWNPREARLQFMRQWETVNRAS